MIRQLWPYFMLSCFSCLHAQDVEDLNFSLSSPLSTASSSTAVPQAYIKPAWLTWKKLEEANKENINPTIKKGVRKEGAKPLLSSTSSFEYTYTWEDLKEINNAPKTQKRKEFNIAFVKALAKVYRRNLNVHIVYRDFFGDHMGIKIPENGALNDLTSLLGGCSRIKGIINDTLNPLNRDPLNLPKTSSNAHPSSNLLHTFFKTVEELEKLEKQKNVAGNSVGSHSSNARNKRPLESSTSQNSRAKKSRIIPPITSSTVAPLNQPLQNATANPPVSEVERFLLQLLYPSYKNTNTPFPGMINANTIPSQVGLHKDYLQPPTTLSKPEGYEEITGNKENNLNNPNIG